MRGNAIEIHNLSVKLDHRLVIKNLAATVEQGQCLALLGPSGSGKTTLLKTIAGLISPERGSILKIFNDDMWRKLPESRPVSMLFQKPAMFEEKTVAENALYGMLQNMNRQKALNKINELAVDFKLPVKYLDQKYENLSGGEQQKAAFIRTFGNAKKIVLLDEPIRAAFDLHQRRELLQAIKDISKKNDLTTIVVTHEFTEAAFLSDKVMILLQNEGDKGSCWTGDLREMYHLPERQYLARVFGFGNELDAKVLLDNNTREKICPFHITPNLPHYNNANVAFIRPHDIRIKSGKGFRIEEFRFYGNYNRAILRAETGDCTIEVEVEKGEEFNLGQQVSAQICAKDIIFFDLAGRLVRN